MVNLAEKEYVVLGIFDSRVELDQAVAVLRSYEFNRDDISAIVPSEDTVEDLVFEKTTRAPEGASTGAASGLMVGGALGWLAGIGAFAIPGVGPFIAAGPIMAALAGAGVGGTVGTLTGALIGSGFSEFDAKHYQDRLHDGSFLISVNCDNEASVNRAREALHEAGTKDVSWTREAGSVSKLLNPAPPPQP